MSVDETRVLMRAEPSLEDDGNVCNVYAEKGNDLCNIITFFFLIYISHIPYMSYVYICHFASLMSRETLIKCNRNSLLCSHRKISLCCDVEPALHRVLKSAFDLQISAFSPDWHLTVKVININEPICIPFKYIALCVHACALLLWLIIDEAKGAT